MLTQGSEKGTAHAWAKNAIKLLKEKSECVDAAVLLRHLKKKMKNDVKSAGVKITAMI